MNSGTREGIYPLHRSKTIHLVRHAQGVHNVLGEKDHSAYMSEELFDAHLTPLGWEQVDNLRKHVHMSGLFKNIELVVVSPLLRTMQTAVGVFGGEASADGVDMPPLVAENTGSSNRRAVSSLNCPPFIAMELCRENMGVNLYNKRRCISEYKHMFPAIDFSLVETDDDVWWSPDTKETFEDVAARGVKFMKWLLSRKEKEIVVVSHAVFLHRTLDAYGDDCHPTLKKEMSIYFKNCELRSMVIVDRSMIGSDTSKTDFLGKTDSIDVASDVV
ncbi:putative histidine phosphatase superfamily, clade-1 [Helianthus anomalus]